MRARRLFRQIYGAVIWQTGLLVVIPIILGCVSPPHLRLPLIAGAFGMFVFVWCMNQWALLGTYVRITAEDGRFVRLVLKKGGSGYVETLDPSTVYSAPSFEWRRSGRTMELIPSDATDRHALYLEFSVPDPWPLTEEDRQQDNAIRESMVGNQFDVRAAMARNVSIRRSSEALVFVLERVGRRLRMCGVIVDGVRKSYGDEAREVFRKRWTW